MDNLKDFSKNVGAWIGRMTSSQVMMLFGVIAGSIIGMVLVVGWFGEVNYSRLYSGLDEAEAGNIVNYLEDSKIPYRLSANGTTIEVPSNQVYGARISLASEGMPQSGSIGYSLFDKNNLGMTDFLQNLNFRRALEGELTRTIMQLREVQAARVHIVMPKDRLFKQDKKEATASIVLKLAGNNGLTKRQIDGISHLVAASVEGLRPANIAIVDYNGELLSSGRNNDVLAGLSGSQLEVRQNVEGYLQEKAQSMLDGVLGNGRSLVRVTADLNFQQLERTSETFDANAPSIRSEEHTSVTNTLSDKVPEANESTETGSTETTITNYELNKTVEHLVNAVGNISRLSIAVTVDGTYKEIENESGDTELIYQPRSQEELDRLSAIVKSAVGFDGSRNDQLELVNIPFDNRNLDIDKEALDAMYVREFYLDVAKKVGLVLLGLIGLLYLKRKSKKLFEALSGLMPPPRPRQTQTASQMADESFEEEDHLEPIRPEKRKPRLVDHMQQTAKEQPDEVAKVIKTMMIE